MKVSTPKLNFGKMKITLLQSCKNCLGIPTKNKKNNCCGFCHIYWRNPQWKTSYSAAFQLKLFAKLIFRRLQQKYFNNDIHIFIKVNI